MPASRQGSPDGRARACGGDCRVLAWCGGDEEALRRRLTATPRRVLKKMATLIERLLTRDMTLLEDMLPTMGPDAGTTTALKRQLDDVDMDNPMGLFLILSAIQQSQFTEALPLILDTLLAESSESTSYCDPEARLFMRAELPLEMITFVVNSLPSRFSLAGVIDSLISLDSNDEVFDACRKAMIVLGDTDFPSWISFANEADFQDNTMVWLFCQHQARRTAPFAPRPPYMCEITERTLETLAPDLKLRPESEEDAILELAKKRAADPELFRVWGPSNLQFDASESDVLDGTADLRMFIDDRFTPTEQGSWFTGSCDKCWLRIKSARYAVRKPLASGGWRGQYCSWDCVRLDCEDFELVSYEMTPYYQKQCNDFGIYDHLFSSAVVEPDDDTAPEDRDIAQ
jgi:hypothetical protein